MCPKTLWNMRMIVAENGLERILFNAGTLNFTICGRYRPHIVKLSRLAALQMRETAAPQAALRWIAAGYFTYRRRMILPPSGYAGPGCL